MKAKAWIWLAGLLVVMTASPAHADPRDQQLRRLLQERRQMLKEQRGQQREQRELQREQQQEAPWRGRLTPEERRQLRRDIRDAGQDVYRRPPPQPPPYPPAGF